MPDDGVIRIGVSSDISGLQSAMAQAQASVREATANMAAAQQQFGQAAAQGNQQAIDALKLYEVELEAAKAAVADLAGVEEQETQTLKGAISARMAGSAELRILEGNFGSSTRAASAFLSTLPGIGAAMQVAFPVFAAVALTDVIVNMGKKLYEAFDLGGERARKTQEEIRGVTQEIDRSTTALDVQIDKLQQEEARLEHKPFNGIKLALDESTEAGQRLVEKLEQISEREKAVIAGMSDSTPQLLLGGSQTKYEQTMLEEHNKWLGQAKSTQDAYNESLSYANSLQTRLNDIKQRQAESDKITADAHGETIGVSYQKEIQAVEQLIAWQQQEQQNIRATIDLDKQQAATQHARDVHGAEVIDNAAARKAAERERAFQEAQVQAAREALDQMKSLHATSASDEAQYWISVASSAQGGSRLYAVAMDEANRALGRSQQESKALSAQVGEELTQMWVEGQKASEEFAKKQDETANAVAAASERLVSAQQGAANAVAQATIRSEEASGSINKLKAAEQEAELHTKAYREELERLDAALTRVSQDAALTPEQRAEQVGQLQAQKAQVQGQQQATSITDQSNIRQQIAQPWLTAFSDINQGWINVTNQMLFSTRHIGLEFAKMGQQIFISIVDNLEKAALQAVEKELIIRLAHTQTVTANTATDATGAAASASIAHTSAMTQGLDAAKLAFKNTYATVSGWPFVGPILAPALASAAFVAVAAFEDGTGYVPRDGMAYLHEGEAVVPAPTVNDLRNSGNTNGGDINITQHNSMLMNTHREFQRMLQQNAAHVARAVRMHLRQAGRG